jgi:osmotically-inducible protein OsmY
MTDGSLILDDHLLTTAVEAFLRNVACGDVSVLCRGGVASLRGSVPSRIASMAVEDLVLAHDGVRSVQNLLVVDAAARASRRHAPEEIEHRR